MSALELQEAVTLLGTMRDDQYAGDEKVYFCHICVPTSPMTEKMADEHMREVHGRPDWREHVFGPPEDES